MKRIYKKLTTSIFIILLLSISVIMASNTINESKYEVNKEKIYYEIKYFDSQIIKIAELLTEDNNFYIDWKQLQKQTDILYKYWNSVILDLNNLNLDKKYLTEFGQNLDDLSASINSNDKNRAFSSMIKLYNKLTIYANLINNDYYKNIILTKYNILVACSIIETNNWTLIHESILEASKNISKVVNSVEADEYKQYNINQAFVAVKEMENLINIKDKNIFLIKYKIAMDKLQIL